MFFFDIWASEEIRGKLDGTIRNTAVFKNIASEMGFERTPKETRSFEFVLRQTLGVRFRGVHAWCKKPDEKKHKNTFDHTSIYISTYCVVCMKAVM